MNTTTRGALEMVAAMAISGTIGWVVVASGEAIPDLLFWRCALGALVLAAFCAARRLWRPLTRRELALCVLGGVAIVANWVLLFASYSHSSISVATVVYNTQPFLMLLLARWTLRERLESSDLAWLAGAFAGVVLLASARPAGQGTGDYLAGVALALGAAFLYAVAALVAKRLRHVPPHLLALVQMAVGCVLMAPFVSGLPAEASAWRTHAAMGIVYTGVVYILLYGAFQKLPTALAGALSFVYPVVAVAVDRLAFGIELRPVQWLGAVLVLAMAAGLNWRNAVRASRAAGAPAEGAVAAR